MLNHTSPQTVDKMRALAVLIAAVAQILTAYIPMLLDWPQMDERAYELDHLLIPQGYAFSIWGVIYLWSLSLTWWHWVHRESVAARRAGWLITGAFVANTVWQIWVPLRGLDPGSLIICTTGLLCALSAALRFSPATHKWQRLLLHALIWFLTGWLTAATFVNLASVLVWTGEGFRPTREEVAAILLGAAILFAAFVTVMGGSVAYVTSVAWGLVAIGIANAYDNRPLLWGEAGLGVIVLLLLLFATKIKDRPISGPRAGDHETPPVDPA